MRVEKLNYIAPSLPDSLSFLKTNSQRRDMGNSNKLTCIGCKSELEDLLQSLSCNSRIHKASYLYLKQAILPLKFFIPYQITMDSHVSKKNHITISFGKKALASFCFFDHLKYFLIKREKSSSR